MATPIKRKTISILLSLMLVTTPFTTTSIAFAHDNHGFQLPNIGTSGATTLSIPQEIEIGDFYVRQFRASMPLIYDPVLNYYLNQLGQRLVEKANYPQMNFHFYLVNDSEINGFAIFGGNIFINSGLISETDTESQLASVLAHEISHVTQRHLASRLENQAKTSPLTWAATIGSILLAVANPEAGIAALTGTMAGTQQNIISFTQTNEKEADRLGVKLLYQAGFDPKGMTQFMDKLADKSRYMSKPPEILLTHPLPENRLSDARDRVNQFSTVHVESPIEFYIARVRLAITSFSRQEQINALINLYRKGNALQQDAANYADAFIQLQNHNPEAAKKILAKLQAQYSSTYWYQDLSSDIDIDLKQASKAISMLENALNAQPDNSVIQINLANAYLENKQYQKASSLLHRYTYYYPNDPNGWSLLANVYEKMQQTTPLMAARAELLALNGQLTQAIGLFSTASAKSSLGSSNQARYDARIDDLRQLQKRFEKLTK